MVDEVQRGKTLPSTHVSLRKMKELLEGSGTPRDAHCIARRIIQYSGDQSRGDRMGWVYTEQA